MERSDQNKNKDPVDDHKYDIQWNVKKSMAISDTDRSI